MKKEINEVKNKELQLIKQRNKLHVHKSYFVREHISKTYKQ